LKVVQNKNVSDIPLGSLPFKPTLPTIMMINGISQFMIISPLSLIFNKIAIPIQLGSRELLRIVRGGNAKQQALKRVSNCARFAMISGASIGMFTLITSLFISMPVRI
jgi:hypothetical protein